MPDLRSSAGRRWTLVSKDRPEWVHVASEQDEPHLEPILLGTTVRVMPVAEHETLATAVRELLALWERSMILTLPEREAFRQLREALDA